MQIGWYFRPSVSKNGVYKRGPAVISCCFYQDSGAKASIQTKNFLRNYKTYNGNFKGH